ncbi:MAG: hypothetical protein IEMM0006_1124 [bacterium]|nr:MAG: hypothetical protein IEMM0006_1124 [bacterium]
MRIVFLVFPLCKYFISIKKFNKLYALFANDLCFTTLYQGRGNESAFPIMRTVPKYINFPILDKNIPNL